MSRAVPLRELHTASSDGLHAAPLERLCVAPPVSLEGLHVVALEVLLEVPAVRLEGLHTVP